MALRCYLVYENERQEYFIPKEKLVKEVKTEVQSRFRLGQDDGKSNKKVVVLSYLGADLKDEWNFKDIGVLPGATIKISEREEKRPTLFVHCSFNSDVVKVMDEIEVLKTTVDELRSIIARLVGLPVGAFRLTTEDGEELFDSHTIDKYEIEIGDTLHLHTWDGWTDFLNLCIMGYTAHVFSQLSDDELIAKYQMKVAMHLACHFGHVDLALNLMKQGVRADDPVGYHPYRQWCNIAPHIDSVKPPIHECAEQGQTALMRALVNYNITAITCKNGYDKTAFQVALMGKQKATAGFLLGKQWSRIQYGPPSLGITLPLNIYAKLKNWCERARDRNFHQNGPSKSTLKRKPYITMGGTLVGIGVLVDGYSESQMNGKSTPSQSPTPDKTFMILPSDQSKPHPKSYFRQITNNVKGAKPRARISNLTSRGLGTRHTSISKMDDSVHGDLSCLPRLDEMTSEEDGGTRTGTVDDPNIQFPELDRKTPRVSLVTGATNRDGQTGQYIETGIVEEEEEEKDQNKTRNKSRADGKKDRMVLSAMKKAKVKATDNYIPLPLINFDHSEKPYLKARRVKDDDPALVTLSLYEKYRGQKARDYAIKCLSIASHFKDKPWLQQVRLAMDLTSQHVKKKVNLS